MVDQMNLSLPAKLKAAARMFHNPQVNRRFRQLLAEHTPDIVYSIYLSFTFLPNILKIARDEFGIPVVYRLSDFHMFCPAYLFYRHGAVCTECRRSLFSAIKHKCIQDSTLMSALRTLQTKYIRLRKWYRAVDAFVCPSRFMQTCLLEAGLPSDKIVHLPTFAGEPLAASADSPEPYILFFGKITEAKGAELLVRAYNLIDSPKYKLRLVGPQTSAYRQHLLALLDEHHRPLVTIEEPQAPQQLADTLRNATFVVGPGLWYENLPNTIIESFAAAKPVIASNLGSAPELVQPGVNGLLVEPANPTALAHAIQQMSADPNLTQMAQNAKAIYEKEYSPQLHLSRLMTLFNGLLAP